MFPRSNGKQVAHLINPCFASDRLSLLQEPLSDISIGIIESQLSHTSVCGTTERESGSLATFHKLTYLLYRCAWPYSQTFKMYFINHSPLVLREKSLGFMFFGAAASLELLTVAMRKERRRQG